MSSTSNMFVPQPDLSLAEIVEPVNDLVRLEAALTESSFGHEYALMDLLENRSYIEKESLLAEMEKHRRVYFWARERLERLNPQKLVHLEEELRIQKEMILRGEETLH